MLETDGSDSIKWYSECFKFIRDFLLKISIYSNRLNIWYLFKNSLNTSILLSQINSDFRNQNFFIRMYFQVYWILLTLKVIISYFSFPISTKIILVCFLQIILHNFLRNFITLRLYIYRIKIMMNLLPETLRIACFSIGNSFSIIQFSSLRIK